MKRFLTLVLAFLFLCSVPLTLCAATADVANDILAFDDYYNKKKDLTLFEETLALAAVGQLAGKNLYYPENDGTTLALAKRILSYISTGTVPNNYNEPEQLADMQSKDGSFGDTEAHCLAILALQASKTSYGSKLAYESLLSRQREDGSFDGSVKHTALAASALSLSENDTEKASLKKARTFLMLYQANTSEELSWQIIGITDSGADAATAADRKLLEKLIEFRRKDNTYKLNPDDQEFSEQATAMALLALNAVNQDASALKRTAQNGELTRYNKEDFRLLIILAIVLLAVSILFWLFIFLHKKNDKTLEETKVY